jgi:hypothetical protein
MIWIALGTVIVFVLTRWMPKAYVPQTRSAPVRLLNPSSIMLTDDITVRPT